MGNKYVEFVTDAHLLACIRNLHEAYTRAKQNLSKRTFYANKIDTIKLTFDAEFNGLQEEELIQTEILRQIDKSINNSIGTFHEEVLGGIAGYESARLTGYDVRAIDNTLFAEVKNKHNTASSSSQEAIFQKLARLADDHKEARCYWVQILAKKSFETLWKGDINGKEYSHSRVFKISGDRFYAKLSNVDDALFQLFRALPLAIRDYLATVTAGQIESRNSAFEEIQTNAKKSGRTILSQVTFENYSTYIGFDAKK